MTEFVLFLIILGVIPLVSRLFYAFSSQSLLGEFYTTQLFPFHPYTSYFYTVFTTMD